MNRPEEWRPVREYEGFYEVSNNGRVKSLPRATTHGGIMKTHVNKNNGYCYVGLHKRNTHRLLRVHKLVYEAFTGDICNGYDANRVINHIDGDKTNNRIENLERVTQSENQHHAYEMGLEKIYGRKVICLDSMEIFNTLCDAAWAVGGNQGEMVARVCRGERSHYRNHHYAFLDDYENDTIPEYKGKVKRKASETLWR